MKLNSDLLSYIYTRIFYSWIWFNKQKYHVKGFWRKLKAIYYDNKIRFHYSQPLRHFEFFVILSLVNLDLIKIMNHLEPSPNSNEIKIKNSLI
jgi:hypothetical protein